MVKMKGIIKNDSAYSVDQKEGGFVFRIKVGEYEKGVLVKNITDDAAGKFLSVLADNGVEPGHLFDVAQDYDFAEISAV